jgi:hypothetical protein
VSEPLRAVKPIKHPEISLVYTEITGTLKINYNRNVRGTFREYKIVIGKWNGKKIRLRSRHRKEDES